MARDAKRNVVFISTFPPRKCGIATFTADLIQNAAASAGGQFAPLVVAMRSSPAAKYADPVKFEIRQHVRRDYICAADYINFSHVDLVSVQHEFGLFGGPAGSYLGVLLKRLKAPIVTTLHTILESPEPEYRDAMMELCEYSKLIVTMNERGVDMLSGIYGVGQDKVMLIPHGIPDLPFVDSNYYKHKLGLEGRRTILTFGLISKNKGIEVMLQAMPRIIEDHPDVVYIVLGMTHPLVQEREGESYRSSLQQIVTDLHLQDHVVFHNRFVGDEELHNFLCAADVYVTPYLHREQLTSGTLAFAVGTGKAVVSTPYWAATELLADNRGRLVPFSDSPQLAQTIMDLLQNDSLFYELRGRAYDYGRARTWPKIGQAYWKLFSEIQAPLHIATKAGVAQAEMLSGIPVPDPSLDHLIRITDDTGLFQHAKFAIPNRDHGYCTDDNARAAIVVARYYAQCPDRKALHLLDVYLSFLMHAQNPDGSIRNFMDFDRSWWENEPPHDALGRTLWALGTVIAHPPSPAYLSFAKDCFDHSVIQVQKQHPRSIAYAMLGMFDYLRQFPGASEIKREMELAANSLVRQYEENRFADWEWFEDILTYDNAVLPHALFVAGISLEDEVYIETARKTAEFLLDNTFEGDHFSFVGCSGWYERGKARAVFDQQPIEAAGTVMMLRTAYDATGDPRFLTLQRRAFDWFLGTNDLGVTLYDFRTQGCHDGLMAGGVNGNQGAESTVSFMLALLAVIESDASVHKAQGAEDARLSQAPAFETVGEDPADADPRARS